MEMGHPPTWPAPRTARALLLPGERGRGPRPRVTTSSRARHREQRLPRFRLGMRRRYLITVTVQ